MSLDTSNKIIRKRCLDCHYALDYLTGNRCPECGREFDELDPATWWDIGIDPQLDKALRHLRLGIAVVCFLDIAWCSAIGLRSTNIGSILLLVTIVAHVWLLMLGIIAAPGRPWRVRKWAFAAICLGVWPLACFFVGVFLAGIGLVNLWP